MSDHPYRDLPNRQFWLRSVASGGMHELDPVGAAPWAIDDSTRVMTLGSCFAQHIARHLQATSTSYLVTEDGPGDLSVEERLHRQYGIFSARYGNIYTARQAIELLRRATGEIASSTVDWRLDDACVDPHRPTVEPEGFSGYEAMEADRREHLQATRQAFEQADVVVFTLGLTEGWIERQSGLSLPLAPGVHGGEFCDRHYAFANATFEECRADLNGLILGVRALNPRARFILTVSPVPLVATYEPRHVLVSTCASKAILRAAADETSRNHEYVFYFPSYDLITAPGYAERYFDDDLRTVNELGVAHVMRVFDRAFRGGGAIPPTEELTIESFRGERDAANRIICDEERLA
jgi:hypothetical protein